MANTIPESLLADDNHVFNEEYLEASLNTVLNHPGFSPQNVPKDDYLENGHLKGEYRMTAIFHLFTSSEALRLKWNVMSRMYASILEYAGYEQIREFSGNSTDRGIHFITLQLFNAIAAIETINKPVEAAYQNNKMVQRGMLTDGVIFLYEKRGEDYFVLESYRESALEKLNFETWKRVWNSVWQQFIGLHKSDFEPASGEESEDEYLSNDAIVWNTLNNCDSPETPAGIGLDINTESFNENTSERMWVYWPGCYFNIPEFVSIVLDPDVSKTRLVLDHAPASNHIHSPDENKQLIFDEQNYRLGVSTIGMNNVWQLPGNRKPSEKWEDNFTPSTARNEEYGSHYTNVLVPTQVASGFYSINTRPPLTPVQKRKERKATKKWYEEFRSVNMAITNFETESRELPLVVRKEIIGTEKLEALLQRASEIDYQNRALEKIISQDHIDDLHNQRKKEKAQEHHDMVHEQLAALKELINNNADSTSIEDLTEYSGFDGQLNTDGTPTARNLKGIGLIFNSDGEAVGWQFEEEIDKIQVEDVPVDYRFLVHMPYAPPKYDVRTTTRIYNSDGTSNKANDIVLSST